MLGSPRLSAAYAGVAGDARAVAAALRGVRAVVCPGRMGALLPAAAAAGVGHVVLLAAAGARGARALRLMRGVCRPPASA